MDELGMDHEFARRYLNEGFSGGEKKRAEVLQLAMLRPAFAILDETDSGLDIDAVRIVSEGVNRVAAQDRHGRAGHHPLQAHPRTTSSRSSSTSSSAAGSSRAAAPSWSTSSRPRLRLGPREVPRGGQGRGRDRGEGCGGQLA